jgi:hypothetical protein
MWLSCLNVPNLTNSYDQNDYQHNYQEPSLLMSQSFFPLKIFELGYCHICKQVSHTGSLPLFVPLFCILVVGRGSFMCRSIISFYRFFCSPRLRRVNTSAAKLCLMQSISSLRCICSYHLRSASCHFLLQRYGNCLHSFFYLLTLLSASII